MGSRKKVVLITLLGIGLFCVISFFVAQLTVVTLYSIKTSRNTLCINNLSQLWKMQHNYSVQFGGPRKQFPEETGGKFWLKMSDPKTLLIDPELSDIYTCPLSLEAGLDRLGEGKTNYRGPARNVNQYSEDDPVGADRKTNHPVLEKWKLGWSNGDGSRNVLFKSGRVEGWVENDNPLWKTVDQFTSP